MKTALTLSICFVAAVMLALLALPLMSATEKAASAMNNAADARLEAANALINSAK